MVSSERPLFLGLFFIPFRTPLQVNLLLFYSVLISAYAACFIVSSKTHGGFFPGLKALINGANDGRVPNWLVVMPLISSALFVVVIFITILQEVAGVSTGSLHLVDPYLTLYSFAYVPILEEWIFRISPLGFVVVLRALRSESWLSLLVLSFTSPEKAKAKAGLPRVFDAGWKGVHWSEWFALGATSIVFGLAHIIAGSGWQAGKFSTATISGLVIGLAFLVYGAYASILLHWFFDFYFGVFFLAEEEIGGIFATLDTFVFFATFVIGLVGLLVVARWLLINRPGLGTTTPYKTPEESALV